MESEDVGASFSKRPVVLIVEDELLLRINAADMISAAGFEVVEATNADDAIEILEAGHHGGVHRYPDARLDGRAEARPCRSRPLATDQDCRHLRPCGCRGKGSAGRRAVSVETL